MATSSSGLSVACARCQARRSGSTSGSVTSESASCTLARSLSDAIRYTAERASGWLNRTPAPISSSCSPAAAATASFSTPRATGRAPEQRCVPGRVGCRQKHQSLRRLGQVVQSPEEHSPSTRPGGPPWSASQRTRHFLTQPCSSSRGDPAVRAGFRAFPETDSDRERAHRVDPGLHWLTGHGHLPR